MSFCRAYPMASATPVPPPPRDVEPALPPKEGNKFHLGEVLPAHPAHILGGVGRRGGREFVQNAIYLFSIVIEWRSSPRLMVVSLITIGPPSMQLTNETAAFKFPARTNIRHRVTGYPRITHIK